MHKWQLNRGSAAHQQFHLQSSFLFFFLSTQPAELVTSPLPFQPAGDRIVKVNGESIIGKTYSQVIALIQNR